jgi:hypothetical protein
MFDYTKMMVDQTITDVKRVFHGYKISAQVIYIAYLVYALIAQTGIWYANLALLILSVGYSAFFMATTDYGKTPDGKQLAKNVKTGIAVAHARGVVLLTANKECGRIYEYTPLQIKQALTGYGRADKNQIQQMVKTTLRLKGIPRPDDAADALAVALCHAQTNKLGGLFSI